VYLPVQCRNLYADDGSFQKRKPRQRRADAGNSDDDDREFNDDRRRRRDHRYGDDRDDYDDDYDDGHYSEDSEAERQKRRAAVDSIRPRAGHFCELLVRRYEDPHRIAVLSQVVALVTHLHSADAVRKMAQEGIVGLPARDAAFRKLFRLRSSSKGGGASDEVIPYARGTTELKRHGILHEFTDAQVAAACGVLAPQGYSCAFLGSLLGLGLPLRTPERLQCNLYRASLVSAAHAASARAAQKLQGLCFQRYLRGDGTRKHACSWLPLFEAVTGRKLAKRPGATVPRQRLLERLQAVDPDLEHLLKPLSTIQRAHLTNALVGTTFALALREAAKDPDARAAAMHHTDSADLELDITFFASVMTEPFAVEIDPTAAAATPVASQPAPSLSLSSSSSSSSLSSSDDDDDDGRDNSFDSSAGMALGGGGGGGRGGGSSGSRRLSLVQLRRAVSPFKGRSIAGFQAPSVVRGVLELGVVSAQDLIYPRSFRPHNHGSDASASAMPVFVRMWVAPFMDRHAAFVGPHASSGSLLDPVWVRNHNDPTRHAHSSYPGAVGGASGAGGTGSSSTGGDVLTVSAHFRPARNAKEAVKLRKGAVGFFAEEPPSRRKSSTAAAAAATAAAAAASKRGGKKPESSSSSDSDSDDDDPEANPVLHVEVWGGVDAAHHRKEELQSEPELGPLGVSRAVGITRVHACCVSVRACVRVCVACALSADSARVKSVCCRAAPLQTLQWRRTRVREGLTRRWWW
jgi:hypothetical protein